MEQEMKDRTIYANVAISVSSGIAVAEVIYYKYTNGYATAAEGGGFLVFLAIIGAFLFTSSLIVYLYNAGSAGAFTIIKNSIKDIASFGIKVAIVVWGLAVTLALAYLLYANGLFSNIHQ